MKIYKLPLFLILFVFGATAGIAQDRTPTDVGPPPMDRNSPPDGQRPNLLRELGLSQDQLRQIRQMNADRRPQMERAQRAMRDAVRSLDEAIYADTVDDAAVAARVNEFQTAQAEISRIRFNSELTVRKILTPDQLTKFRELRRRFEEERRNRRQVRRNGGGGSPLQPMSRQGRPPKNIQ